VIRLGVVAGDEVFQSIRGALIERQTGVSWLGEALGAIEHSPVSHVLIELSSDVCPEDRALPASLGALVAGIVISDESVQIAKRLGISRLIASRQELTAWLDGELDDDASGQDQMPRSGRIVAVYGVHGAPGVTTIAISLAALMSQSVSDVVLIDANTYAPAVALSLALPAGPSGLVQACRLARLPSVTPAVLRRQTSRYPGRSSGFDVLTGVPDASRYADVEATSFRRVLEILRDDGCTVVIDCAPPLELLPQEVIGGPIRNAATRVSLELADCVIAVATSQSLHIERLARAWPTIQSLAPAALQIPVLNKAPRGARGSTDEAREALWSLSGIDDLVTVPDDSASLRRVTRDGVTLADLAQPGPIVTALHLVLGRLGLPGKPVRHGSLPGFPPRRKRLP